MQRINRKERGSMFVLGAGLLLTLTSFAVFAFDVGRIMIVRNELQNAADAAALAGAICLPRQASSATDCVDVMATAINWTTASAKAEASLSRNSAANRPISTNDAGHQIEAGYWNLSTQQPSGGGSTLNPLFSPLTADDKPAVRVTIRKDAGVNNGPVALLTRLMFGGGIAADVPVSARAVAVLSAPGSVPGGSLIPHVINKCMYDLYWDSTTNSPKLATTSTLAYRDGNKTVQIPQTIGQPWRIRIGSAYHYGTCDSGQWSSFAADANDVTTVRNLITNGNPTPLNRGDPIWIEPGTKTTLYGDLDARYPTPSGGAGWDVSIAVVNAPDLSIHGTTTIHAFAGFHIDDIQAGSNKYIEGHFIRMEVLEGSSGTGPFYGVYTPPRLGL